MRAPSASTCSPHSARPLALVPLVPLVPLVVLTALLGGAPRAQAEQAPQTPPAVGTPSSAPHTPRLDARVRPELMELRLDVDPDRDFLLGSAVLTVRLAEALPVVRLHGRGLEVSSARLAGAPATWTQLDEEGTAEIAAEKTVGPGLVKIEVEWRARLGAVLEGVYVTSFEGRRYLSTQFEAVSARDAFPCFDEPGTKTPVALTLFVDEGDVAAANTAEVARASMPDGRVRVTFATSEPMPAYLVAFAVGPWDVVDGPTLPPAGTRKRPLPLRALVARGQGARVTTALNMTAASVRAIERYTGVGYAYGKLDLVAVPDFAWGGMENIGLITYRDSRIFLDAKSPVALEKRALGLIAHEVAHQWFGNLVTAAWWDDIWLNEAFATWMASRAVEQVRPDFLPRAEFREYTEYVLTEDSLLSARQVRQPVTTKADILDAFDGVTYGKGASVIRMFEGFVGAERFRSGVRAYLTENRHASADASALIDAVARNTRVDVRAPFFSFLEQPGVPMLEMDVVCDGAPRVLVKQERFLPVGSRGAAPQTWQIPVCVLVDGREVCRLITTADSAIDLGPGCPKAVLPDAGGRGYYRWSLPPDELAPLVDGSVRLTVEERIAVSDAIRAGFTRGTLSFKDALALALPLARDDSPLVAQTPLVLLEQAGAWFDDDATRARIGRRVKSAYGPIIDRIGLLPPAGDAAHTESPEQRALRTLAVNALVGLGADAPTRRALLPLARARFGVDDGVIREDAAPADLTEALGVSLVALDAGASGKLRALLPSLSNSTHRREVLAALGSTRDPAQASALLELSLGETLNINERLGVLRTSAAERRTRGVAFAFLERDLEGALRRLPESSAADVPLSFASACSEDEAVRVERLFSPVATKFRLERALAQSVESIRLCATLAEVQHQTAVLSL